MRTALSLGKAIDKAAGGLTPELAKAVTSAAIDPLAVMKAVHATGGVSVIRPGVTAADERFSVALAATLRKLTPTPAFHAALEKVRAKAAR